MGNVQGPEKVNDTCLKIMHAETIDRGFTVLTSLGASVAQHSD
jgi:hypothetical protein